MRFATLLKKPAEWMRTAGPHNDIVMTSRVRLARNLVDHPFPGWAEKDDRLQLLSEVRPQIEELPEMRKAFSEEMTSLSAIEKQVLVERHLISREHAAKGPGCATVMNRNQTVSIMINEEDHLRMQAIRPGLQLLPAFRTLDRIDSELDTKLPYAFDARYGYLTACPTNLGTGMRASAMLHLPGLVLSEQINPTIQAANKIGLAVRGLYGEGSEALANLSRSPIRRPSAPARTRSSSISTKSSCKLSATNRTPAKNLSKISRPCCRTRSVGRLQFCAMRTSYLRRRH